jgi:hypothetical protein
MATYIFNFFHFYKFWDKRTFFDLSLKEIVLRYVYRALIYVFFSLLSILIADTFFFKRIEFNVLHLIVLVSFVVLIICKYQISLNIFNYKVKRKAEKYYHIVNQLIQNIPNMVDSRKKFESNHGIQLTNILAKIYKDKNDIEKYIICRRYNASFLLFKGNYNIAIKTINDFENYTSKLNEDIKNENRVRAEIARVRWLKNTILYEAGIIDDNASVINLTDLLSEFKHLNLEKEIQQIAKNIKHHIQKIEGEVK